MYKGKVRQHRLIFFPATRRLSNIDASEPKQPRHLFSLALFLILPFLIDIFRQKCSFVPSLLKCLSVMSLRIKMSFFYTSFCHDCNCVVLSLHFVLGHRFHLSLLPFPPPPSLSSGCCVEFTVDASQSGSSGPIQFSTCA